MKVFVVGAGTMGSGIAQVFAAANNEVILNDVKTEYADKGYGIIQKSLQKLVDKGNLNAEVQQKILDRITTSVDLKDARESDLVVEAIREEINIKKELFKKLDEVCRPEAILATNTSSLSVTEIASQVKQSDRVIGMHFFNPAPVMKLVELIRSMTTADATFDKVREIALAIGKEPVEVKEGPGYVVNRILIPMINEAVGILAEGLATAADIDKAMRLGANHPIGPLALADLIGNDVNLAIMEVLYQETGDSKYRPHPYLRKMVRAGFLGRKTGRGFFNYLK
jgi:3-hydroxybutyryl-CoA dehydrogenase